MSAKVVIKIELNQPGFSFDEVESLRSALRDEDFLRESLKVEIENESYGTSEGPESFRILFEFPRELFSGLGKAFLVKLSEHLVEVARLEFVRVFNKKQLCGRTDVRFGNKTLYVGISPESKAYETFLKKLPEIAEELDRADGTEFELIKLPVLGFRVRKTR